MLPVALSRVMLTSTSEKAVRPALSQMVATVSELRKEEGLLPKLYVFVSGFETRLSHSMDGLYSSGWPDTV